LNYYLHTCKLIFACLTVFTMLQFRFCSIFCEPVCFLFGLVVDCLCSSVRSLFCFLLGRTSLHDPVHMSPLSFFT
jgi:hypothetical protein